MSSSMAFTFAKTNSPNSISLVLFRTQMHCTKLYIFVKIKHVKAVKAGHAMLNFVGNLCR